jgi:hypothetical protein
MPLRIRLSVANHPNKPLLKGCAICYSTFNEAVISLLGHTFSTWFSTEYVDLLTCPAALDTMAGPRTVAGHVEMHRPLPYSPAIT